MDFMNYYAINASVLGSDPYRQYAGCRKACKMLAVPCEPVTTAARTLSACADTPQATVVRPACNASRQ